MNKDSKIYVAGHTGLVGSAIIRNLKENGYMNIICKTHKELNLMNQNDVRNFFSSEKPEYVFLAAAKVGGINANDNAQADFIYENLMIEANVIKAAHDFRVKKLMFLGSSCIYPRICPQPIKEEYLLSSYLEPTNEGYALAKISGLKMCQFFKKQYGDNFISVMPTNLYGTNDNFDLNTSHVVPALIRKFHEAKIQNKSCVEVWGTGEPRREFLHVDDMADACIYLMKNYDDIDHVNIGTGTDITIKELTNIISKVIGFKGEISFNPSKPDGTPRKLLDVTKINSLGWKYTINLQEGIENTYNWFVDFYRD